VFGSGGVEYAYSCLEKHVDKALEALECLPPSEDRDMLSEIAVYNSSRTK
jgi:geranylgeranyl pyrophosphate synthase